MAAGRARTRAMRGISALVLSLGAPLLGCSGGSKSGATVTSHPDRSSDLEPAAGDRVFVALGTTDAVAVLDVDGNHWTQPEPVGRNPVEIDGPVALSLDASGEFLYVLLAEPDERTAPAGSHVHAASRAGYVEKLSADDLRIVGETRVDADPVAMALSDDGRRLIVAHAGTAADVSIVAVIDTRRMALDGAAEPVRIPVCISPVGVALSRGAGGTAYVACEGEDAVALVDTRDTRADILRISIPSAGAPSKSGPRSVAVAPSGGQIAVTSALSMDVRLLDADTGDSSGQPIPVPGARAASFSPEGGKLAVVTHAPDGVSVVDTATGVVVSSREFGAGECEEPENAVFGMGRLYVLCAGGATSSVVLLDASAPELAPLQAFPVGDRSEGFSVLVR